MSKPMGSTGSNWLERCPISLSSAQKETAVLRVATFVGLLCTALVVWFLEGVSESPLATPPLRPSYRHKHGLCFADIPTA